MFDYNSLTIRLIEKEDLAFLMDLRANAWKSLGNIEMLSQYKQEEWFDRVTRDRTKNYYVLLRKSIAIGIVRTDEIDYINRSIRVGGDIHIDFRGLGYGIKMMQLVIKYCFDYLNMNRLWLSVLETNKVALYIYKKVGFRREGNQREAVYRDGKYIDYITMSLLKSEYSERI